MMHKKKQARSRAITIRKLPPEVERAILERARTERISINRAVVGMLEERVGVRETKKRYADLDELAGAWTREEAEEFDRALREQRRPDPELWQQ
jgi:hypothetical protein